eukprot:TRINITY_DN33278_c0_g1_i1.p1 TRINITY_DN33278_c0_g1~~TRINITY_DN33278_c0_g1_i1.p1  ORF type:complete len:584 (+),score=127.50 TRINITY_DN33278_c0_g1_i1:61-1812(+)
MSSNSGGSNVAVCTFFLGGALGALLGSVLAPRGAAACPSAAPVRESGGSEAVLRELLARADAGDPAGAAERRLLQKIAARWAPCPAAAEATRSERRAVSITNSSRPSQLRHTGWQGFSRVNRAAIAAAIGELPWWQLEYRKGPDSGLLLSHPAPAGRRKKGRRRVSSGDPFSTCLEVNVVVPTAINPGSCLLIAETSTTEGLPYFVDRFCRGWGSTPKERCKSPDAPLKPVPRPNPYGSVLPSVKARERARGLLMPLFRDLEKISGTLEPVLAKAALPGKRVGIMTTNKGDLDLLLNWYCSAKAHGLPTSNMVVIASDEESRAGAEAMGLAVFRSESLGTMPVQAANAFGDRIFAAMMWMKIVSVWLACHLGYTVLFQDADVVWFKDPWEYFDRVHPEDDTVWMDDSARTDRFGPYFANSGFYLVRSTTRALQWAQETLYGYDTVAQWGSHQQLTSQMLADGHSRYGLRVGVLNPELFASGAYFHYRMVWMRKALVDRELPYVFHMCWTSGKREKLLFLKTVKWWWLHSSGTKCLPRRSEAELQADTTAVWTAFSKLRMRLDGRSIEQRTQEDIKSRRPFVLD